MTPTPACAPARRLPSPGITSASAASWSSGPRPSASSRRPRRVGCARCACSPRYAPTSPSGASPADARRPPRSSSHRRAGRPGAGTTGAAGPSAASCAPRASPGAADVRPTTCATASARSCSTRGARWSRWPRQLRHAPSICLDTYQHVIDELERGPAGPGRGPDPARARPWLRHVVTHWLSEGQRLALLTWLSHRIARTAAGRETRVEQAPVLRDHRRERRCQRHPSQN
jgi:hypothetical protein